MSLNYPTAFWKGDTPDPSDSETSINWSTNLYYGGPGKDNVSTTRDFPITVGDDEFYTWYYQNTNFEASNSEAYFGWFLDGNPQYSLSDFHPADPFIIEDDGRELNFFFEADLDTVDVLDRWDGFESDSNPTILPQQTFNKFIQSGYALGSFTLSSTSNLQIKVSGLGEKYNSENFDRMHLGVDTSHVCKGESPGGGGTSTQWDMNQVKLFNSAGTQSPDPAPDRAGGTYVDQDNRRFGYTTAGGQGTFNVNSLSAGSHEIKIYFNTNDGIFNSGAFYGFKFTFS